MNDHLDQIVATGAIDTLLGPGSEFTEANAQISATSTRAAVATSPSGTPIAAVAALTPVAATSVAARAAGTSSAASTPRGVDRYGTIDQECKRFQPKTHALAAAIAGSPVRAILPVRAFAAIGAASACLPGPPALTRPQDHRARVQFNCPRPQHLIGKLASELQRTACLENDAVKEKRLDHRQFTDLALPNTQVVRWRVRKPLQIFLQLSQPSPFVDYPRGLSSLQLKDPKSRGYDDADRHPDP